MSDHAAQGLIFAVLFATVWTLVWIICFDDGDAL